MSRKTTVLMILDGYGLNEKTEHNAVALGKTPVMDRLMKEYPFVQGNASGMAVGLPDGQMGNSEVGHLNMGAGRIVYQELTRITKEIQDGTFFENPALLEAVENCKAKNSALHMFGLLSDGGVHSHNTHLYGLLELAKRNGLSEVYVHCFLDGRDTPPASGKGFAEELEAKMAEIGVGRIASVMGRYYAMDRDNNYDRVQKAYEAMTEGKGEQAASPRVGKGRKVVRHMFHHLNGVVQALSDDVRLVVSIPVQDALAQPASSRVCHMAISTSRASLFSAHQGMS